MFNFIVKKTEKDNVDISVKIDINTIEELKSKALSDSKSSYNESLKENVKERLFKKYGIDDLGLLMIHDLSYREAKLLDVIIEELIDKLDLAMK